VNEVVLLMLLIGVGMLSQVVFKKLLGMGQLFDKGVKLLVDIVYYVLIPIAFVKTYMERGLGASDAVIVSSFVFFTFFTLFTVRLVSRSMPMEYRNALFLVSTFPNAVFLGFPVSMALFGTIHVASIYGLATLALNILVPEAIAIGRPSMVRILTIPALYGFTIGVLGHYLAPSWLASLAIEALKWAPQALSYTATAVLGARLPLGLSVLRGKVFFLTVAAIYRFVVAPVFTLVFMLISGTDFNTCIQMIVVSMMPPAVLNTLIADRYGWHPELVASVTLILTIVLILLLPALSIIAP